MPPEPTPSSSRPPEKVEHGGVLGHADRLLERQGHDAGAEPDAARLRRDMREEDERRGQPALAAAEVVLRHPRGLEAERLGADDLLGRELIALGGADVVEQPGEEAEAFDGLGTRQFRSSFFREWHR